MRGDELGEGTTYDIQDEMIVLVWNKVGTGCGVSGIHIRDRSMVLVGFDIP